MIDVNLGMGLVGMSMILIGFFMEEFARHSRHESITYNVINIVGSLFLVFYALGLKSWPFLILNAVWFLLAIVKIWQIMRKK